MSLSASKKPLEREEKLVIPRTKLVTEGKLKVVSNRTGRFHFYIVRRATGTGTITAGNSENQEADSMVGWEINGLLCYIGLFSRAQF